MEFEQLEINNEELPSLIKEDNETRPSFSQYVNEAGEELSGEERQKKMIDRMKLKNKIMRYRELFPHHLAHFEYRMEEIDKMSEREMEFLIEELSIAVNTRNSSGLTKMLYFESCRFLEIGGAMAGMQIAGLSEALKQNQAIHDVLNELALKYESDMFMQPEIRLAYLTCTTAVSLHKLNSTSNTINGFLQKEVSKNITEEYKDL
jgi:hypothetical protein